MILAVYLHENSRKKNKESMQVIAEVGSTKADWRFVAKDGAINSLVTPGFNPNYHSQEQIRHYIEAPLKNLNVGQAVTALYYYGTGCSDEDRCSTIANALQPFFPQANLSIHHDLLGAARATCMHEAGITIILGTGSNTILYDGEKQVDNVPSLGYIMADEGGGFDIGKRLVKAYFYRELPNKIAHEVQQRIPNGKSELLDNLYKPGAIPAAYLASFAPIAATFINEPFIQNLLTEAFQEIIDRHLAKYPKYQSLTIHFVGSIAYHFQSFIRTLFESKGFEVGKFVKQPIDYLVAYHGG